MEFIKSVEDIRGKILFCSHEGNFINIAEIKKGYSRGGHYHKYDQEHLILSGKVEYHEEKINSNKEIVQIFNKPPVIHVPAFTAHLLIALENTIFVEFFKESYDATNFPKFRNIVENMMNA